MKRSREEGDKSSRVKGEGVFAGGGLQTEALFIDPENLEREKSRHEILLYVSAPAIQELVFAIPPNKKDGILIQVFASTLELAGRHLFAENWRTFYQRIEESQNEESSQHPSGITILIHKKEKPKEIPEEFSRLQNATKIATDGITGNTDSASLVRMLKELSSAITKAKPFILDDTPSSYNHLFYVSVGVFDEGISKMVARRDIPSTPAVRALYSAQASFTDFYY